MGCSENIGRESRSTDSKILMFCGRIPSMPCPEGIDIPRILDLFNDASVYGGVENARTTYLMEPHRSSVCTACRTCEEVRLGDMPIVRQLKRAHGLLE